jgi:hypothetical protein
MKLADLIDKLVEIQNQHPDEEIFVTLEDQADNYGYGSDGPRQLTGVYVEKLLISEDDSFYRPEGLDFGNRKTVVVLDY